MFVIEEELKKLPAKPGVYLMHDEKDEIIYVGKAISLKNRVRQYFQSSRNKGVKIEQMVTHIRRFEYIVTDSELEALVLECNLIKEYRPKYNTMLVDDKTYPFIKVTVQEPFPRIMMVRRQDKAKYFGPFTSSQAVKDIIDMVRKLYRLRSCGRTLPRDIGKERPCLYYHIKQCDAPCQGYISSDQYRESIDEVVKFLSGHYDGILKELEEKMLEASEQMEFEKAIEYRELISSVKKISEKQKITDAGRPGEDRDVLAVAREEGDAVVQVFFIRGGRLIGRDHFYLRTDPDETKAEILASFIKQFYAGTPYIPRELLLPYELAEADLLTEWMTKRRGHKVTFTVPKKGEKEKLCELAQKNAAMVLAKDKERLIREAGRTTGAVRELEKIIGIAGIHRMEAFDISNTNGFASVGSMVVYEDGKPKRSDYRKFRIKGVEGADDYASMREVLTRRFQHGLKEKEEGKEFGGFTVFPDLILMDGGKGQVHIAEEVLDALHIQIPVCGMVKDDRHRTRGLYYRDEELPIRTDSEAFKLITRVQDEAHRFAIEFHRKLRAQGQVHSILDEIPGVGPKRRKDLMKHFQSLDAIRQADVEELKKLPTMNEKSAQDVYNFFH